MKFGITNLSWKPEQDSTIIDDLRGFDYFETVFNRIDSGVYYSTQSIFYQSGLTTFEDVESTTEKLTHVIEECHKYGLKIIVFGSPKLRKGSKEQLHKTFAKVDPLLNEYGIYLCVEPNASYYGGEYYHRVSEIAIDIACYSNIMTMIDSHNLILEGDDLIDIFNQYEDQIKHIHFSEKDLKVIQDYTPLEELVELLVKKDYQYGITYELCYNENIVEVSRKFLELKSLL